MRYEQTDHFCGPLARRHAYCAATTTHNLRHFQTQQGHTTSVGSVQSENLPPSFGSTPFGQPALIHTWYEQGCVVLGLCWVGLSDGTARPLRRCAPLWGSLAGHWTPLAQVGARPCPRPRPRPRLAGAPSHDLIATAHYCLYPILVVFISQVNLLSTASLDGHTTMFRPRLTM